MQDDHPLALTPADRLRLVRAAHRLLGPADAEDAVQDACVRALEAPDLELAAPQAWLLTVMRHLAIDRLRRRQWMAEWRSLVQHDPVLPSFAPSAEAEAVRREGVARALAQLAGRLHAADGAAVLLHEVFDATHADIAAARGQSEAASRQQLRRALLRLRSPGTTPDRSPRPAADADEPSPFELYLHAIRHHDARTLWAMLHQAPISASSAVAMPSVAPPSSSPATCCELIESRGHLALVLTLDGVRLCVVPLGVLRGREQEMSLG